MLTVYDLQITISEDYCPTSETSKPNSPLVGSISLDAAPVTSFTGTQLTSVVSVIVDDHTVILTTTSTGRLVKVICLVDSRCNLKITHTHNVYLGLLVVDVFAVCESKQNLRRFDFRSEVLK